MSHRLLMVPVSKLLLDQSNPRLGDEEQPNQQATEMLLAKLVGNQLLEIAQDIVANGMDPLAPLAITPDGAPSGKFWVIEGNRRLLALRSLKNPDVVRGEFMTPARRKRLLLMSESFRQNPITSVQTVIFDTEEEAVHWIDLRHTGAHDGVGLVSWDSNEQDRYRARHGLLQERSPAGQVLDFVDRYYPPVEGQVSKVFTTLERLMSTAGVRSALGIEVEGGVVYSNYPLREVLKGLSVVVGDLRNAKIRVGDVYYKNQRDAYIETIPVDSRPDVETRLAARVPLSTLDESGRSTAGPLAGDGSAGNTLSPNGSGNSATSEPANLGGGSSSSGASAGSSIANPGASDPSSAAGVGNRKSRIKPLKLRATVIPRDCVLWINQARINSIYHELAKLEVDNYSNACAVLLRVFVELSVDHHISAHSLIPEDQLQFTPLAKKLKSLAAHLRGLGKIELQLEKAVIKIADGSGMFSASTTTFNQYVHNAFAYPLPAELRTAWDELQPFMAALWVK